MTCKHGVEQGDRCAECEKLPDLARTSAALDAYDELDASLDFSKINHSQAEAAFAKIEKAAEAVGIAFGEDTKDRNNPDDCRKLIRPGHKVPGPGYELSAVRKWVNQWKAGNVTQNL